MQIVSAIKRLLFIKTRISKYRLLSSCKNVKGKPNLFYPLLLNGEGEISFGSNFQNGVVNSPKFFSGYNYIEARGKGSRIIFGDNVAINNGFSAVAFNRIVIGNNVLIGTDCRIEDGDGHFIEPAKRNDENPPSLPISIGNNVFIGSGVTILKGITIGENSVIGSNSIVTKSIPANVIAAGNPAKIIRQL